MRLISLHGEGSEVSDRRHCRDVDEDPDELVLEADYGISNMLLSEVLFTFIYFNISDNAGAVVTNSEEDKLRFLVEYN